MFYIWKCRTCNGKCRTYTRSTVESAVRTQSLQWKVPYVQKVYSGKCRTYTKSTVESAVRTQSLQWKVPYVHKVYSGKCRTCTRSTVESAVRTQGINWKVPYAHKLYSGKCRTYIVLQLKVSYVHLKVPYVHKVYSGKCRTYTRSTPENDVRTLESAVRTQVQRESSVCDRRRRVVLNSSQTAVRTQTDVFVCRYGLRFWLAGSWHTGSFPGARI